MFDWQTESELGIDRELQSSEKALKFLIVERQHALEGDAEEGGGRKGELSRAVDSPGALAVDGRFEGRAKEAAAVFSAAEGGEGQKGSDKVTGSWKGVEDRRLERIEAILVSLGQNIDGIRSAETDARLERIESKLNSLEGAWPAPSGAPGPRNGGDGVWGERRQGGATAEVNDSDHVSREHAGTMLIMARRRQIDEDHGEKDGGRPHEGIGRSIKPPGEAGEQVSPALQHHPSNQSRIRMTFLDLSGQAQQQQQHGNSTSNNEAATMSRHSNQAHPSTDHLPHLRSNHPPLRSGSPNNRFRDAQHAQARRRSHSPQHMHPRRRSEEPESVPVWHCSYEGHHPKPQDQHPPQQSHRTDKLPFHHQASYYRPGREHGHGKAHGRHDSNGVRARAQSENVTGDGDNLLRGKWERTVDLQLSKSGKRHQETNKIGNGHGGGLTRFENTHSRKNRSQYHAAYADLKTTLDITLHMPILSCLDGG